MDALMLSKIAESQPDKQGPATIEHGGQIALPQMTQQQRTMELRQRFAQKSVPLPHAATPTLCNVYPELANDIVGAYLEHTTFVVKVWVNYDAAWKKFFVDRRAQDCGKLIVNARDGLSLQGLAANNVQVKRVRLEVGTAFRHLCDIVARASSLNGELRCLFKPQSGQDPELMFFLRDVCTALENDHLPDGQQGLTVRDIEYIARLMLRRPEVYEWTYLGNLRFDGPWMNNLKEGSIRW